MMTVHWALAVAVAAPAIQTAANFGCLETKSVSAVPEHRLRRAKVGGTKH